MEHKAQNMFGVCLFLNLGPKNQLVKYCKNYLSSFTFNFYRLFVNFLFRKILLFPQEFGTLYKLSLGS